jgi:beta-lactamase superfamily II metal-dependent hydrolase
MMKSDIQVDFWNVGQGDASSITLPGNELIVIDVGPMNSTFARWLCSTPRQHISNLLITHNDSDHCGSLPTILDIAGLKIDKLYLLEDRDRCEFKSKLFTKAKALSDRGLFTLNRLECVNPSTILWNNDKYSLVLKHPSFSQNVGSPTPNKTSAIITLTFKDKEMVVWGGDAPFNKIQTLNNPNPPVLFGPHHGSPIDKKLNSFNNWIKSFAPQQTYVSVGTNNKDSHPSPGYIKALSSTGCYVTCSQMTNHCTRSMVSNNQHLMNTNGYYGLPSPSDGVFCRGHLRFFIQDDSIIPDRYESLHRNRILKIRRAICR